MMRRNRALAFLLVLAAVLTLSAPVYAWAEEPDGFSVPFAENFDELPDVDFNAPLPEGAEARTDLEDLFQSEPEQASDRADSALLDGEASETFLAALPYRRLYSDYIQNSQLNLTNNAGTLDLNGYRIYNTAPIYNWSAGSLSLISVQNGGGLKIVSGRGGGLFARAGDCYAIDARYGGQILIQAGVYSGNQAAVYAVSGGQIWIQDGTFGIRQTAKNDTEYNYRYTLYADDYSSISVTGGYFYMFNPADTRYHKNYVADGYYVKKIVDPEGTWYKVLPRHNYTDRNGDGVCDVCGMNGTTLNYVQPEGKLIGILYQTPDNSYHYHICFGDGATNYRETVHTAYQVAKDSSRVWIDCPVTFINRTGRDPSADTLARGERLSVQVTAYDGRSFTVQVSPRAGQSGSLIASLIQEGVLRVESENEYPRIGAGSIDVCLADSDSCFVRFDSDGGSAVPVQTVKKGEKAVRPVPPTRADWWFGGWYTDKSYTAPYDFDAPVSADVTLCAKWIRPDLVLPAETTVIAEEAFAGGAFRFVKLSEKTVSIQSRAFADCLNLAFIYIPASASIDPQAFGDRSELTVYGKSGSAAEDFAKAKGFEFIPVA